MGKLVERPTLALRDRLFPSRTSPLADVAAVPEPPIEIAVPTFAVEGQQVSRMPPPVAAAQ